MSNRKNLYKLLSGQREINDEKEFLIHLIGSELESQRELTQILLKENNEYRKNSLPNWQNRIVENNIKRLKKHLNELKQNLETEKLEIIVNSRINKEIDLISQITYDHFRIVSQCSIPGSILTDINWLDRIDIIEKGLICERYKENDITISDYKFNEIICFIKEKVIPELMISKYRIHNDILRSAINLSEKENYIESSILLIPTIEGILRKSLIDIYSYQNKCDQIDAERYVNKFNTLERLISEGNWKNDIAISFHDVFHKYYYIDHPEINFIREIFEFPMDYMRSSVNDIKSIKQILQKLIDGKAPFDEKEKVNLLESFTKIIKLNKLLDNPKEYNISIKVVLNFLIRRYKDDRNGLMHGHFSNKNCKWKNYTYLCAIEKVFEVITLYNAKLNTSEL